MDAPITVGRIVHYHEDIHGEIHNIAAIVTRVWSPNCANLKVFGYSGDYAVSSVSKATTYGQVGCYSFPPRV